MTQGSLAWARGRSGWGMEMLLPTLMQLLSSVLMPCYFKDKFSMYHWSAFSSRVIGAASCIIIRACA